MNQNLFHTACRLLSAGQKTKPARFAFAQGGFSLIELMAVIAITAVLAMIALPSFRDPLVGTRVSGATNLFVASIDTARSEAMTKNAVVVICRSSDPMAANPNCDTNATAVVPSKDWSTGWLVFSRGTASPAAGPAPVAAPILNPDITVAAYNSLRDTLIQRVVPTSGQNSGDRTRLAADTTIAFIGFGPQGTRLDAAGIEPTFAIEYRNDAETLDTNKAKCVRVNLIGRAEVTNPTGASC